VSGVQTGALPILWSGGGRLRVFSGEPANVSDFVHGECHMIGGVERWWEVKSIQW
jgi:hypothetical protein